MHQILHNINKKLRSSFLIGYDIKSKIHKIDLIKSLESLLLQLYMDICINKKIRKHTFMTFCLRQSYIYSYQHLKHSILLNSR